MAQIPNAADGMLDVRKLEKYCLDPLHPPGKHKARVFREALGIVQSDCVWLREVLLDALGQDDAEEVGGDVFGSRWRLDVVVTRHGKQAVVRTLWIVKGGNGAPHLVTCWVR